MSDVFIGALKASEAMEISKSLKRIGFSAVLKSTILTRFPSSAQFLYRLLDDNTSPSNISLYLHMSKHVDSGTAYQSETTSKSGHTSKHPHKQKQRGQLPL